MSDVCPVCGRPYGGEMQEHHLKPKTFNKRANIHEKTNKVTIHKVCHSAIHAFFKEKELFTQYNTILRLVTHIDMINFIKWIANKPDNFYVKMKRHNRRK